MVDDTQEDSPTRGPGVAGKPRVALVVAAAANNVIGRDGRLPWRQSEDLKRFKAITMGSSIIMGRATWESIGRPLPGRRNIVLTRRTDYPADGAIVVNSPAAALAAADPGAEIMVIGGGEIYALFLPIARRIYLTRIHAEVDGDAFFPDLDAGDWTVTERTSQPADADNDYPSSFLVLERRATPAVSDSSN